ncbi:ankyrin and armadillo repeat-containing protein [Aplysia californica]|uniref:Ankyrin and armadillo repeat-containing protein n=1 Tax=Aplysia californica TaxID=6500 RepID=A0ABM0JC17_APLCA|nr:ankyrin and armadillo repeat-containing protein [Aplysia californica]
MASPLDETSQMGTLIREAASYFDNLERYDSQELLAFSMAHWMLSTDVFRLPTDQPQGLISNISPKDDAAIILFPVDDKSPPLCYREVHNIIRELTIGMYVMHQTPLISLEANYDLATVCNIPPAYQDTRIGQLLIAVDYMMKALWHGAYFPKDKRTKFSERWRTNLDVNASGKPETKKPLLTEFLSAGLLDITKDPDFGNIYDEMPAEIAGDAEMAEERRFFMSHVDSLSMKLTFCQDKAESYKNMYIVQADYEVSSIVSLLDNQIDHTGYERLKTRLQMHEEIIKKHMAAKQETRRQLELLKLVSYLTPFLLGMRKRMKIPDINKLMSRYGVDECRTERELPPLIVGPEFKCKNFMFNDHYFHLHGGITMDLETDTMTEAPSEFIEGYSKIVEAAQVGFHGILHLDQAPKEHYNIPVVTVDGQEYYAIMLQLETFYGTNPQRPLWVRAYCEEMDKLKPKRLPIPDNNIHEQFKKNFGYKKAIKYKTPFNGLKICAQRGMVAMFSALARKMTGSRISKQDENGLSFLHHAAINNRPQIMVLLLMSAVDVNVRRNNILSTGPTALHMAARCGSLDGVTCLLANYANILATDQDGWAPIHHAAFFDHKPVIKLMVRKNTGLLELPTKNDQKSTPLLLAASSGGLSAVQCLIELGAMVRTKDGDGNDLVTLSALRFHTNVLEFMIQMDSPDAPVWDVLVDMLNDESMAKKDSAVKCLEVLSTSKPDHWKCILEANGVPALVSLLHLDNVEIQSVAASVLCNTSENYEIRLALSKAKAGPILIQLLSSEVDDIQSRAAIILSDIACIEGNQTLIADNGGIAPLVNLLDSELEDVLVNAVNAIRVLCNGNQCNQDAVAQCGGLEPLVEFLDVKSEDLQAGAAAALAAVTAKNIENQNAVIKDNAHKPLVELIRCSRSTTVQVKAASAVEALATNNAYSQKRFLELDAPKALIRLLKNVFVEVREQGACALWSLAGNTKTQQKYIAERITIPHIIQMLLEATEKLLYVGCMTAIALGYENMASQNKLASADAFQQLVRLLRSAKTSEKVLLMVIKVLGILCVGVAYRNNKVTQRKIAEEGGIPVLVHLLIHPPNDEIKVEVAISLGCVVLSNKENQEKLQEEPGFKFNILLALLKSKDQETQLRAGMALTIFAFNNTPQQFAIREAGGIKYSIFEKFVNSQDEFYQCYAAFQIVVLARVIVDRDQVPLTAQGITMLVDKIGSDKDKVVVLACSLLSSLAHTRAGLTDAMITTGALDLLVSKLDSENDLVRNGAAVTMGYLTFNKTAYRLLFSLCRNMPGLYNKLMDNIGDEPRINSEFINDFKRAMVIGLPTQCLEINGGRPVESGKPYSGRRPNTSHESLSRNNHNTHNRAVSAPMKLMRSGSGRQRIIPDLVVQTNVLQNKNFDSSQQTRPASTSTCVSSKTGSFKTKLSTYKK